MENHKSNQSSENINENFSTSINDLYESSSNYNVIYTDSFAEPKYNNETDENLKKANDDSKIND